MESASTNIELEWVEHTNSTWALKNSDNIANRDLVQSMYDILLQNKEVRVIPTTVSSYSDVQVFISLILKIVRYLCLKILRPIHKS